MVELSSLERKDNLYVCSGGENSWDDEIDEKVNDLGGDIFSLLLYMKRFLPTP